MLIELSLPRWDGIAKLKGGAEKAAIRASANPQAFSGYVKMLGGHHAELKLVKSKYSAVRTYFYNNTLPFSQADADSQKRGARLIPVCRVPEFLAALQKLIQAAEETLESFLVEYDRFVSIAQSDDLGEWKNEVEYPSADEVRGKFGARISPPRAIPSCDMARFGSLPAALAAEIAEANAKSINDQLMQAKQSVMNQAEDQMKRAARQLKSGGRMSSALIENSAHIARLLRDMTMGFDNDPRLIAMADLIDENISKIANVDVWKSGEGIRKKSYQAATTVSKGLRDLRQAADKQAVVNKSTVKQSSGNTAIGGLLADLI